MLTYAKFMKELLTKRNTFLEKDIVYIVAKYSAII